MVWCCCVGRRVVVIGRLWRELLVDRRRRALLALRWRGVAAALASWVALGCIITQAGRKCLGSSSHAECYMGVATSGRVRSLVPQGGRVRK